MVLQRCFKMLKNRAIVNGGIKGIKKCDKAKQNSDSILNSPSHSLFNSLPSIFDE